MLSSADKVVPLRSARCNPRSTAAPRLVHVPGLKPEAIAGVEAHYPGTLTPEMRALLQRTCGLSVSGFGTIDFTGRWHPTEPLPVLRPSPTLAQDDEGRRWIAETSRQAGLPGPIWCIFPEPAVALYVSEDLQEFLGRLEAAARPGRLSRWLRALDGQAREVWAERRIRARASYEACREDPALRGWLSELPFDAQLFDLRTAAGARGWPYGLAGPHGRLYRCGRLPVFAVAQGPTASRWRGHMARIAATREVVAPAVVSALAA